MFWLDFPYLFLIRYKLLKKQTEQIDYTFTNCYLDQIFPCLPTLSHAYYSYILKDKKFMKEFITFILFLPNFIFCRKKL